MSPYLESKLKTFQKALSTFEQALQVKNPNQLEIDGAIQRYEYCYELAWKTIKIYLADQGINEISSPKNAFQKAFINNLIKEEETWLEMIQSRNLATHTYNEKFAKQLYLRLPKYSQAMNQLLQSLAS